MDSVYVVEADNDQSSDDQLSWLVGLASSVETAEELISRGDCNFHPSDLRDQYVPSTEHPELTRHLTYVWVWHRPRAGRRTIIFIIYEKSVYQGGVLSGT